MTRKEFIAKKIIEPDSYLKGYVAFLDILGFKEICKNESCQKIKAILDDIELLKYDYNNSFGKLLVQQEIIDNISIKIVSDSIIITAPDNKESITFMLWFCASLQNKLLNYNILLRGGIEYGMFYSALNTVFGPALVGAYEIENDVSIYPRIVLSDSVIKRLDEFGIFKKRTIDDYISSKGKVSSIAESIGLLVTKDEDSRYFVHYFNSIQNIVLDKNKKENIQKFISESVELYENQEKLLKKYIWLNEYFKKNCTDGLFRSQGFYIDNTKNIVDGELI